MSQEEELRGKVEDALSALVQAGHGDQAVTGAWVVCAEVMVPGKEEVTVFMHDGGGSMLARRGLIESVRDQLSSWVEGYDD
nr:MAG TPA: hypothetical protein [Caudoviricetes sp.]